MGSKLIQALRRIVLQYPEAEERSCGSKAAFAERNKALLFIGMDVFFVRLHAQARTVLAGSTKTCRERTVSTFAKSCQSSGIRLPPEQL
jgi:hypothetical protein